ncbi:papilin b, proteoglycan-like sulfated glycoprotein [Nematolebias whitei]|uniref:papilin b, proteoglycan-like sulfated glycoprotein n=1 Tax=Nematolebias whitei TaxID=451745 RepID=UPI00189A5822|nr:papilin b, proteoglycan-like sulfated glycoprotein [Nematolebias whitei]
MNILQVLGILFLAAPAFTLTQPVYDYWGEFGAYGPCSRTCGTGVAMRIRKCITSRIDGGHNCVGSSKSFRTCNTQACPVGSRNFREEQCSEFDRVDFQGKRHTWEPYYGASNPCELNCVPRGENFFYRHRPTVVDGTPCYVGRADICVDGICRLLDHEDFMGLDNDTSPVQFTVPVAPHPRETLTYTYSAGVFGECSASCDGGMQYRSVECLVQDPSTPHQVVDESNCITQRLRRPPSQQACNMHPCAAAEYSVSSFSVCSVTCGEGQQTREVICMGPRGEHLLDHACTGLAKPASVRTCRRPACHTHITWHVTEYGLCSRSCGGGVRERKVACFDTDLNPYPEDRCRPASRPSSVETCNSQPCHRAQMVPSVQNPDTERSTMRGFQPHEPTGARQFTSEDRDTGTVHSSTPVPVAPHPREALTYIYGTGDYGECSATCDGGIQYRSVECLVQDPSTPQVADESYCIAQRLQRPPSQQACNMHPCAAAEYSVSSFSVYQPLRPVDSPTGNACFLPRDEGACETWTVRFTYDNGTGKCKEFWYGGCHGNANNFISLEACQRACGDGEREPAPMRVTPRGSIGSIARTRAQRARLLYTA